MVHECKQHSTGQEILNALFLGHLVDKAYRSSCALACICICVCNYIGGWLHVQSHNNLVIVATFDCTKFHADSFRLKLQCTYEFVPTLKLHLHLAHNTTNRKYSRKYGTLSRYS